MKKSVSAVRMGGHIAVIGVLTQGEGINPVSILQKTIKMHGIFVGSRQMFEDMNRLLCQHTYLKPVIDKTFAFEEAKDALRFMEAGAHFGKIVVKI